MDENGLMHHDGNTEESYHYLMDNGSVNLKNFNVNTYKSTTTIQLPSSFKGKEISFVPFPSSLIPRGDTITDRYWGALSKLAYEVDIDKANATVTLTVECRYFHTSHSSGGVTYPDEYATPLAVGISYIAIA